MHTVGELPAEGTSVRSFDLVGADLGPVASDEFTGQRMVLNIFPSLDTGVCAQSVREFNKRASELQNTASMSGSRASSSARPARPLRRLVGAGTMQVATPGPWPAGPSRCAASRNAAAR